MDSNNELLPSTISLPESNTTETSTDKQTLLAVLQFLKKNNLKGTEEILRKECKLNNDEFEKDDATAKNDVSHALAAYKSERDPSLYEDLYSSLKAYIDSALDANRCELSLILYPVFVHMYLELVYNGHEQQAKNFFHKFSNDQEEYYQGDIHTLSTVTKKEHMQGHELMDNFKTSKFVIRMSRESYSHLKRHLQERQQNKLFNFILEKIYIDVFDGNPRSKLQIDAVSGSITGESLRDANRVRVYYGLLKEPDINIPLEEDDEQNEEGAEKPKKKKPKKDPALLKKAKNDPNSPQVNRIPLPELKDTDKLDKVAQYRETLKRVKLGPDCLPSVCFYTILNAYQGVTSVEISEDSSLLSAGFSDSSIRVLTLTPIMLRKMKSADELELINKEADDVLERMMDNKTAEDCKTLLGHAGPVYATSFSKDKNYLLSASEDGTIRLWSLLTWTNIVSYKGHNFPVWCVQFSPHGHYFASCSHDRTARLWSTDHYQPLRIFSGHLSDVECVRFHPNSNYVATGSVDRTVRLWDVLNGACVRVMTGHKGAIQCLCFSPDGRYLASAGSDKTVILWDIANGNQISQLKGHSDTIYSLCFSREGSVLASGGIDKNIFMWDFNKLFEEQDTERTGSVTTASVLNEPQFYRIAKWSTKNSPLLHLHFTRRNLLIASGPFSTIS